MSGFDSVLINTRERAASGDVNNLQDMVARDVLDLQAGLRGAASVFAGQVTPGFSRQDVVVNGLIVTSAGVDITIGVGALMQESATVPVVPGPLDSNYRIGVLRLAATETLPAPGGNTYFLLQAQVDEVITVSTIRDIFDPGTGLFVPTLVTKQVERQVSFNFKAGTATQLPAPDADNVPIAGIFRPAGGGAGVQADIIDLRPLWMEANREIEAGQPSARVESYAQTSGFNNYAVTFDFAGYLNGKRLFAKGTDIDFNSATFLESGGSVGTAFRWHYVYLVQPRGFFARNMYASITSNAMLIVSRVGPTADGVNSGTITLPEPFAGVTVAAGEALFVGLLFEELGAEWEPAAVSREGRGVATSGLSSFGLANIGGAGATSIDVDADTVNGGVEALPFGTDTYIGLKMFGTGTDGAGFTITVSNTTPIGDSDAVRNFRGYQSDAGGVAQLSREDTILQASRVGRRFAANMVGTLGSSPVAEIEFNLHGWQH